MVLFGVLIATAGRISEKDGLGWDGVDYANMTTRSLAAGTANTQLRPLVIVLARLPYYLTRRVVLSFRLMNVAFIFALCLFVCLLFDVYHSSTAAKTFYILNLFASVAVAKFFAYYPVLVDLGAYAVLAAAIYFIAIDRRLLAAAGCVLAVLAREFGIVAVALGVVRDLRRGVPRRVAAATYLPALAVFVLLRLWVQSTYPEGAGNQLISLARLLSYTELWRDPVFAAFFAYFAVTLFGGVSMLLVSRPTLCLSYLRQEPEWGIVLLLVGAAAAVGHADIWRYLAYGLPVATMLFARCAKELSLERQRWVLMLVAVGTLLTQRPFEGMTLEKYFVDWFPVYVYLGNNSHVARSAAFDQIWVWRFLLVALVMWVMCTWRPERESPVVVRQSSVTSR